MANPAIPLPQYGSADRAPEIPGGGGLDIRVPVSTTGAAVARGLDDLGRSAESIGLAVKSRIDAARIQDADTAFGQEVLKRLYDPGTGVIAQRGRNAGARFAQSQQDLVDYRDDIANRLDDPAQRQQFHRAAAERLFQFGHLAGGHVAREAVAEDEETAQAATLLANENAVAVIANAQPDTLHQALDLAATDRDRVVATAHSRSDPAYAGAAISTATTPFDRHVIDTLVSGGHIDAANAWFATHADSMTPDARLSTQAALQAATRSHDARSILDEHLRPAGAADAANSAGNPAENVVPQAEFLRRVQADPRLQRDDALRQQVVDRGLSDYWQRDQASAAHVAELRQRAWKSFASSPDGIGDPVFQGLVAQLPPDSAGQLLAMARNHQPVADPIAVRRLEVEAAQHPAAFARLDLSTTLDPRTPEFRALSGTQGAVRNLGVSPDHDAVLSVHQSAVRAVAGNADPDALWRFDTALAARVRASESATGRRLTPDEIDRQAQSLVTSEHLRPSP